MLSEDHPSTSLPLPAAWFLGHVLDESTKLEREDTSMYLGINTPTWGVQGRDMSRKHVCSTPP